MGVLRNVKEKLRNHPDVDIELDEALREAERLADVFEEVKPQPYVVPIERFAGLPVFQRDEDTRG